MKNIISGLLGLSLMTGAAGLTFAQDKMDSKTPATTTTTAPKKVKKHKKAKTVAPAAAAAATTAPPTK